MTIIFPVTITKNKTQMYVLLLFCSSSVKHTSVQPFTASEISMVMSLQNNLQTPWVQNTLSLPKIQESWHMSMKQENTKWTPKYNLILTTPLQIFFNPITYCSQSKSLPIINIQIYTLYRNHRNFDLLMIKKNT